LQDNGQGATVDAGGNQRIDLQCAGDQTGGSTGVFHDSGVSADGQRYGKLRAREGVAHGLAIDADGRGLTLACAIEDDGLAGDRGVGGGVEGVIGIERGGGSGAAGIGGKDARHGGGDGDSEG
jgi:hypothetical protein